jgi:hypothetical protein
VSAKQGLRSGDRIMTGTGANRRRLTTAEAEAGALPELMTKDEWDAMHTASHMASYSAFLWWKRYAQRVLHRERKP